MTRRARIRRVAHREPPRLGDSPRGMRWAAKNGYRWADVNCLLSREGVPHAAHGAPFGLAQQGFLPDGDARRVRDLRADELFELRSPDGYRVPSIYRVFRAAAKYGVNVELEPKDDHRFTKPETWHNIAFFAEAAWGDDWAKHVQVKCLTNLSGGLTYARRVL
ncbi:MAG: hypothetical protein HOQ45_11905, partial [Nocardioidaceae bacterium]|nr:hypothetical protein [Nocardioidaceae bacterium]